MSDFRVEWNPAKARANLRKHHVAFDEAETVFADDRAILLDDPEHATTEERFALLGLSARVRMLVVIHCYREGDDVVRLISARKATRNERAVYDAQEL